MTMYISFSKETALVPQILYTSSCVYTRRPGSTNKAHCPLPVLKIVCW